MGLTTSRICIFRARSIPSVFVVPKLMLLFTIDGWSAQSKQFFYFYFQTWQRDTSLNIFESDHIFYLKRKKRYPIVMSTKLLRELLKIKFLSQVFQWLQCFICCCKNLLDDYPCQGLARFLLHSLHSYVAIDKNNLPLLITLLNCCTILGIVESSQQQ